MKVDGGCTGSNKLLGGFPIDAGNSLRAPHWFHSLGIARKGGAHVDLDVRPSYLATASHCPRPLPGPSTNIGGQFHSTWLRLHCCQACYRAKDCRAAWTLAGVKVIHLILAAQNSVVFNLGRRYDKRNVPDIVVYQ